MNLYSRNFNRWGYGEWAVPLIHMLFEAQVKHIQQGILNLLGYFPEEKISYYYLSTEDRGEVLILQKKILSSSKIMLRSMFKKIKNNWIN